MIPFFIFLTDILLLRFFKKSSKKKISMLDMSNKANSLKFDEIKEKEKKITKQNNKYSVFNSS